MNMAGQGGDEFSRIRFSKRIEGVALRKELGRVHQISIVWLDRTCLVHGEQCVPLLEEFVQVVRHFHLGLGHLVAEGEPWEEL